MSSEYPSKAELTKRGLSSPDQERPSETTSPGPGGTGSRTARPVRSGIVQLLAHRSGRSVDEVAADIPADNIRRTKFPVITEFTEDGKLKFKEDPGIVEARRSTLR